MLHLAAPLVAVALLGSPPPIGRRALLAGTAAALPLRAAAREPPMPEAERRLLRLVEERRPAGWAPEERPAVDALIDELVALRAPWPRDALTGTWRLVYLQPGPDGAGVDRRVPFPEFGENESFQVFGDADGDGCADTVTNVGELLGPAAAVLVSGGLREEDGATRSPKRFRADIDSGRLCLGGGTRACLPLPISGVGLFDGVYLGSRLRIGQNLNGGGARIVQVRVDGASIFAAYWGLALPRPEVAR